MKGLLRLGIITLVGAVLYSSVAISAEATPPAAEQPKVTLKNVLTMLKLSGRASAGYLRTGPDSATLRHGSFEVPDVKLVFNFIPDDKNSLVLRFNLNNLTAPTPLLDYGFVEAKDFLPFLKGPFSLNGKMGRMKQAFGEETFQNNSIEGPLTSNSAANVGATDEGLELSGKLCSSLGWAASVSNGQTGVGSDIGNAKAWSAKLSWSPWNPLNISGSFYDSGSLKASAAEMSIAGLSARPTGATNWKRRVGEIDVRFDFGKGKKPFNDIAHSDSKAIIRASYGHFQDEVTGADGRDGKFGFVDGLVNIYKGIYVAGRVSFIDLNGSLTASLNSVTTNHYARYTLGGGYRWSDNVHVKAGYDFNRNGGEGTTDSRDDLLSMLLAIQF